MRLNGYGNLVQWLYQTKYNTHNYLIHPFSMSFGEVAYAALQRKVAESPDAPIQLFGPDNKFNADIMPGPFAADLFAYFAENRNGANITVPEIAAEIARNRNVSTSEVQAELSRLYPILRDVDWLTLRRQTVPGFRTAGEIQRDHLTRQGMTNAPAMVLDGLAETLGPGLGVVVNNYTYR